ncbi:MAG: right-handed parallel beta-helix repeat-containing protein [Polyangiaceae bacterium]
MPSALAVSRTALVAVVFLAGCSSSSSGAPDGLACGSTVDGGGDGASLTSALRSATTGTCVLVSSHTYRGSFVVPAGVTLASARGSRATITGDMAATPAIQLLDGGGSGLFALDVNDAAGVGVAVRGGPAKLSDVGISGAKGAALAVYCREASCASALVELVDVRMQKSVMGLWVSGSTVKMTGGASTDHGSGGLSGGGGVVVQDGAHLEMTGTDIERNESVGVLVDGMGGSTGALRDVTVSNNLDRGIWAQRISASMDAPGLRVEGEKTAIENNRIVGLGAAESHGIIFVGGKITDTAAAPILTSLGTTEMIGDGIGLFGGSGDVRVENVTLARNARTAGLIDTGSGVIIFVGGKVETTSLKIVVQNTTSVVTIDPSLVSMSSALGVSAPQLPLAHVIE